MKEKFKQEAMNVIEKAFIGGRSLRDSIVFLYWNIFGETCQYYKVCADGEKNKVSLKGMEECLLKAQNEYLNGIEESSIDSAQVDIMELLENPEFKEGIQEKVEILMMGMVYLWKNMIVNIVFMKSKPTICLFVKNKKEAEEFLKLTKVKVLQKRKDRKNIYSILIKSNEGLEEKKLLFDYQEIDIKKNYNDDLPWNELMKFVDDDKEGLALLYGPAGTGKTTLLKGLIQENPRKEFVMINSKDLETPDNGEYLEYFLENKNRIFILEDCEKLLLTRNQGGGSNQLITILNMTDGLLGSTMKTKFICTFNTNLRNIDEALLRKGRLRLKYCVGTLSLEKTRKLMNDSNVQKEMTLAEIYNRGENDFSKKEIKKIGF